MQASPFLMHANEYLRTILSLVNRTCIILSTRWIHAIGRELRMIPRLRTMYKVSGPFLVFWGAGEHVHLFSGNNGKYFKATKLIFGNRGHGNFENHF